MELQDVVERCAVAHYDLNQTSVFLVNEIQYGASFSVSENVGRFETKMRGVQWVGPNFSAFLPSFRFVVCVGVWVGRLKGVVVLYEPCSDFVCMCFVNKQVEIRIWPSNSSEELESDRTGYDGFGLSHQPSEVFNVCRGNEGLQDVWYMEVSHDVGGHFVLCVLGHLLKMH